ncbi:MAG: hypothetical protein KAS15_03490, partial [Nanoarchaeota archaeon]|nr:hypothetical protein [Nanoarchaeota archaeon]
AKQAGAKISTLEAEGDGVFVWGRLGYKMTDRGEYARIAAQAKNKNIIINSEADFYKLKKYADEFKLPEMHMQKIL